MTLNKLKMPDRAYLFGPKKTSEMYQERQKKREEAMINDELLLAKLGYKQSLNRQLSAFSNFAISFGCCSVLSGLLPVSK
jgi:hypothetical protein